MPDPQDPQNVNQPPPTGDPSPAPVQSPLLSLNTDALKAAQKKTASKSREAVSEVVEKEKKRVEDDHKKLLSALDVQWRDLEVQSFKQDIRERHNYARRIFVLIVCWLISILLILAFQGWSKFFGGFDLKEKILLALIGGTTASVLALFTIVAKYLFPDKKAQPGARQPLKATSSAKKSGR